jgi:hypothetical protein
MLCNKYIFLNLPLFLRLETKHSVWKFFVHPHLSFTLSATKMVSEALPKKKKHQKKKELMYT